MLDWDISTGNYSHLYRKVEYNHYFFKIRARSILKTIDITDDKNICVNISQQSRSLEHLKYYGPYHIEEATLYP